MARNAAIWIGLACAAIIPLLAAGISPLLAWREPVYIIAGFAGIIALAALLFQPLLVARALPDLSPIKQHTLHRRVGITLTIAVVIHVVGLWITSPPDVIDALLFASPTPFSIWGVIAMWAVFITALLARFRHKFSGMMWRRLHKSLAIVIVIGTVLHALLIQGTMETVTKAALCLLILTAMIWVIFVRRL